MKRAASTRAGIGESIVKLAVEVCGLPSLLDSVTLRIRSDQCRRHENSELLWLSGGRAGGAPPGSKRLHQRIPCAIYSQ